MWVSVVDPKARIFGINHFHLTNKGYGRFTALYLIDSVPQFYGSKHPLPERADAGPWSDGRLTYTVVRPLEEIRIVFDGPRYAFDLRFRGRFSVFDYADCPGGNPLCAFGLYGGHYEQAMECRGMFEIRHGPARGEVRELQCFSHRDHSWSARFSEEEDWEWPDGNRPAHFWPTIQLPNRQINAFGLIRGERPPRPGKKRPVGGWVASADGVAPLHDARATMLTAEDRRTAVAFRYTLTLADGTVLHVRTGHKYGQVKLWCRGENDLENRLDCYEPFFDLEVEETGERGSGVCEYSIYPPHSRWLV